MGLMPIMWSMGTGADVMKRVAAPMVGGLATSFLLELLVYPAVYLLWRTPELRRESRWRPWWAAPWPLSSSTSRARPGSRRRRTGCSRP
jgi:hypothetical protein